MKGSSGKYRRQLHKLLEDIHAGSANSFCLLALSSGVHERGNSSKHDMGWPNTAPPAKHDTARHRMALRRAVELAKLDGACACVFVVSGIRSWV